MEIEEIKQLCREYLQNRAQYQSDCVNQMEERQKMAYVESFLDHIEQVYGAQIRKEMERTFVYGGEKQSWIPVLKMNAYLVMDACQEGG